METLYNLYYIDDEGKQFKVERIAKDRVMSFVSYCLDMEFEVTSIIDSEKD